VRFLIRSIYVQQTFDVTDGAFQRKSSAGDIGGSVENFKGGRQGTPFVRTGARDRLQAEQQNRFPQKTARVRRFLSPPPPPRLPPARPSVRPSSLLDPAARSRGLPPPRKYFECTSTSRDFPPRPLALPPLPRPSVLLSAGENKIPPKKGRERKEEKRNCRAKKCAGMHFEGICSGPGPGPVWKSGMENEGISPEISLPPLPPPSPLSLSLSASLTRAGKLSPSGSCEFVEKGGGNRARSSGARNQLRDRRGGEDSRASTRARRRGTQRAVLFRSLVTQQRFATTTEFRRFDGLFRIRLRPAVSRTRVRFKRAERRERGRNDY